MKVILLQKVAGVGQPDDIKDVADGYAKNFLFPKHLAVQASNQAITGLASRHARVKKEAEQELKEEQFLASRADGLEVALNEKVSNKGQLYAAVTTVKVADQLKKMGINIAKERIYLKPIKEPGNYPVKIKFSHGLEAFITVVVNAVKINN